MWGIVQQLVYQSRVHNTDELKQRLLHVQHVTDQTSFTSDNGGGICFRPRARVRLSVCKITKNACMDLNEMLRVDRSNSI